MAIDPRKLKPNELTRLVNSTPQGTVLSERQLHRHRTRAGYRVGDDKTIDLFRYAAWLVDTRHQPLPEIDPDPYAKVKERARARNQAIALAGRDIGPLPEVVDPVRKATANQSFQVFCETYFPQTFHLEWSDDHLKVMRKIEEAVLKGGLFAMAMPRGSGKTSLCECGCIWALLTGAREFVCLIGSDESHAEDMLSSIKTELESNELLLEDFPEVVYPIHRLDGIANRCTGQLYQGERTYISWTAKEIVLPTIPESPASGGIIRVAGITGRIRGMKFKRADGRSVRPSLVILDDPQTDESARSLSQCVQRESILAGAVLGLAGPGQKISGIMPCTVIRPGDMADRILDRDKHPEWNGERTKMVYAFPSDEPLWQQYAVLRAEGMKAERGLLDATEFYRQHQAAMDAGAIIAWPARFNYDELSAIQHAMNLKLQDQNAFFAEYQNEPLSETVLGAGQLSAEEIASKINRLPRAVVPLGCTHLTAFIDVQGTLLYYLVAAWSGEFTGAVLDYGAYPDQRRPYFTLREANPTLATVAPRAGLEGSIFEGLTKLTGDLLGREWKHEGGAALRIERCLIDANWGLSTDTVYQFCRTSAFANVVTPSHGRYVGASNIPFAEYTKGPGDKVGHNWRIPSSAGKRALRHVLFDTNSWKSFVFARLATALGDPSSLALFGNEQHDHRMFADHLVAEYPVTTTGRGRSVEEWKERPNHPDNHFLDCIVGCAVAGSMLGAALPSQQPIKQRKRVSLAELAKIANRPSAQSYLR